MVLVSHELADETTTKRPARSRLDESLDSLFLERRRATRVAQERPVKIYEPYASRFFGGQTIDVSGTGMKLAFPAWAHLNVGRVINVHVGLAAGLGQPLANRRSMIPARIVWIRHADETADQMVVGVEFLTGVSASAA